MNRKIDVILQYIASADVEDMNRIIGAVIQKCDEAAPERETVFLSLPKDNREGREKYLQRISRFLLDGDNTAGR